LTDPTSRPSRICECDDSAQECEIIFAPPLSLIDLSHAPLAKQG
jgi:hypothetical protein